MGPYHCDAPNLEQDLVPTSSSTTKQYFATVLSCGRSIVASLGDGCGHGQFGCLEGVVCFGLGALAILPSIWLENGVLDAIWFDLTDPWQLFLYAFLGIALIEEAFKAILFFGYPYWQKFFNDAELGKLQANRRLQELTSRVHNQVARMKVPSPILEKIALLVLENSKRIQAMNLS